jgi:hypothetical protein
MQKTLRKVLIVLVVVMASLAVIGAWIMHDPARDAIRISFHGYIGDLKTRNFSSASHRILPDDLGALKASALVRLSESRAFREEAMTFFEVANSAAVASVAREGFFEFLLVRTFAQRPEIHDVLSDGQVLGLTIRRAGEDAEAEATLGLDLPEGGMRYFSLKLRFRRSEDVWLVRL